ncbi:MAG TPA: hypothetical protein P5567_10355 [Kiritimatiellia bacterium]|nr:hypothetical protein [Kiritimatiellia bacterium]HRZ12840.1 hypothetical protein [Kiritimatiellia bacterium]HSA18208.1 hypothetical protein [Kiritimatiellia bacterium]
MAAVSLQGFGFNTVAANILVHNGNGVYLGGGQGNLIGGYAAGERNVISSNTDIGMRFAGPGPSNNLMVGNFIGTSPDGLTAWPNRLSGVAIDNANGNTIGGTSAAPQVISGNGTAGISMSGTNTRDNRIVGNLIGTDASGTQKLANAISGIALDGTIGVIVGGTNASERNVISGNGEWGVHLNYGAFSNRLAGNIIGLASHTGWAVSNGFDGVRALNSPSNYIGAAGGGNIIGGSRGGGITVEGTGAVGNVVQGNVIGMGFASNALPNSNVGILVWDNRSNRIGGTAAGEGNTVVYSKSDGIYLRGSNAVGNLVLRNLVGVDAAGTDRGNDGNGVRIDSGISNQVGATLGAGRNVISGNSGAGVYLHGGAQGNMIYGNYIGLNPAGSAAVSNENTGVHAENAPGTVIGMFIGGNVISGNLLAVNLVYSNQPRGNIDLGGDGPTANDPLDADAGPNQLQNSPALGQPLIVGGWVYVQGSLTGAPSQAFSIDVYQADGTNFGSRAYIGRVPATTDAGGVGSFASGFTFALATGAALQAVADADSDSIPDYWETLFGLDPAVSNAPTDDADGDFVPDVEEYVADTPANDPAFYLAITSVTNGGPARYVSFPSKSTRLYEIDGRTTLSETQTWSSLIAGVPGNDADLTWAESGGDTEVYFRAQASLP